MVAEGSEIVEDNGRFGSDEVWAREGFTEGRSELFEQSLYLFRRQVCEDHIENHFHSIFSKYEHYFKFYNTPETSIGAA